MAVSAATSILRKLGGKDRERRLQLLKLKAELLGDLGLPADEVLAEVMKLEPGNAQLKA